MTLSYLTVTARANCVPRSSPDRPGVRHDAGEAPESVITTVPTPVLLVSGLLSVGLMTAVVAVLVFGVLALIFAGPVGAIGSIAAVVVPGPRALRLLHVQFQLH